MPNDTIELPLSKGYVAIIDADDAHLAQQKWCASIARGKVYAVKAVWNRDTKKRSTERLHHAIMGKPPSGRVWDHKNGDTLDCRRSNLRLVSVADNAANRREVAGVCFHTRRKKWQAHLSRNGQAFYLRLVCHAG